MPLLDVRSGSDFTGGAEGSILFALELRLLAICTDCVRGCLRNSFGTVSIASKSTTATIAGIRYRRFDFDVFVSPATNSSAVVAPRVSREDCSWAAINCRVQRLCGSRTRQCRAMSAKCGGTVLGRNNFSLPTGEYWLNASNIITPSAHTSETGQSHPI